MLDLPAILKHNSKPDYSMATWRKWLKLGPLLCFAVSGTVCASTGRKAANVADWRGRYANSGLAGGVRRPIELCSGRIP